jgi:hypothetical protein
MGNFLVRRHAQGLNAFIHLVRGPMDMGGGRSCSGISSIRSRFGNEALQARRLL